MSHLFSKCSDFPCPWTSGEWDREEWFEGIFRETWNSSRIPARAPISPIPRVAPPQEGDDWQVQREWRLTGAKRIRTDRCKSRCKLTRLTDAQRMRLWELTSPKRMRTDTDANREVKLEDWQMQWEWFTDRCINICIITWCLTDAKRMTDRCKYRHNSLYLRLVYTALLGYAINLFGYSLTWLVPW